ncbi:MAG: HD domain-containing protein [Myxococcota bacterium]|jgi:putative nucleotidyltransferase with HDIG domain|nr:HD domain-containing protein [Myxococcota bacterium]
MVRDSGLSRYAIDSGFVSLIGPPPPRRVLFVDDEETVLRAFMRDTESSGFEVVVARTSQEALSALADISFSAVLADFQMPEMNGIEFLEKVRLHSPDTVRILVSGKAELEVAVEVINRVGLFQFISKPWDRYTLRDTLGRALEHHTIALENRRLSDLLGAKCEELALASASLENQVEERTTSLLLGLINALDLRDTETQWHSRRVAIYARRLAEEIALSDEELLVIERGALLHDIGKIGVADAILLKPGKLTSEEWEEMRRHSELGYRILQEIEFLGDARDLVLQHHERWDGKGYPTGRAGKSIYIGARIFAIIDTYDAMTSDRPYRKAMAHAVACEEISKCSGSQFDPDVVEAWKRIEVEIISQVQSEFKEPEAK